MPKKYPNEPRERATQMALDRLQEYPFHGELGHLTPEEYEQAYYAAPTGSPPGDAVNKKTA